jgi:hypothetical protein
MEQVRSVSQQLHFDNLRTLIFVATIVFDNLLTLLVVTLAQNVLHQVRRLLVTLSRLC